MSESTLIVMAKRPELGKVKTRFARTEGDEAALELYRRMLQKLSQLIQAWPGEVHIWWSGQATGDSDLNGFDTTKHHFEQLSGDLGQRMKSAFDFGLNRPDASACLMIGADCPDLTIEHLREASELLRKHEVVFGRANDGGYYLIGIKRMHESLFVDIPWSTPEVLHCSTQKLLAEGCSFAMLSETLVDIDEIADLKHSTFGRTYKTS